MRTNTAKQKMLQGKPAYGYSLGLGSPLAAEALASSGIDFILLDNQHGSFGRTRRSPASWRWRAAGRSRWRASPATTTR